LQIRAVPISLLDHEAPAFMLRYVPAPARDTTAFDCVCRLHLSPQADDIPSVRARIPNSSGFIDISKKSEPKFEFRLSVMPKK
jgi:hypothetical protein